MTIEKQPGDSAYDPSQIDINDMPTDDELPDCEVLGRVADWPDDPELNQARRAVLDMQRLRDRCASRLISAGIPGIEPPRKL